jgi:hypothetical protein
MEVSLQSFKGAAAVAPKSQFWMEAALIVDDAPDGNL